MMSLAKATHGGARPGAGRHPVGRRQLTVRIKAEILEALAPDAASTIRDLVERTYAYLLAHNEFSTNETSHTRTSANKKR